ncbi:hypothetical protein EI613_23245 [Azospirillum sp. 412522]|nr:hypothetical protein [Azospirillum sp. 412522]MBY6264811.1 hypothetical protein [Azospirillum sp. 412522]
MKHLKSLPLVKLMCTAGLAAGIAIAALPAAAQSTGTTSPNSSSTQNAPAATSGQLPPDSLPGQRQGAIGGAPVPQGNSGSSSDGSVSPTGQLPSDSLQQQRQGVIGGKPVPQGGSGESSDKQGQQ